MNKESAKLIWSMLRSYKFQLSIIFICLILESFFYTIVPFSFKFIIDASVSGKEQPFLVFVLTALICGVILIIPIGFTRDYLCAKVGSQFTNLLRQKIFSSIEKLPLSTFLHAQTGFILSRFSTDVNTVEKTVLNFASRMMIPIIGFFISFIFLSLLNVKLALFALCIWPLLFLIPRIMARKIRHISDKKINTEAKLLEIIHENIDMQPIIRAYSLTKMMQDKFVDYCSLFADKVRRLSLFGASVERSGITTPIFLQIILIIIGAYMIQHGSLTIGSFVAFQFVFATLIYTLIGVTHALPFIIDGFNAFDRINAFLTASSLAEEVNIEKDQIKNTAVLNKEITFDNITFSYIQNNPILNNINLIIPRGKSIAFLGKSGSGKSTLINLLLQFHFPTTGNILLDGIDVKDISISSWRNLIACVFQEPLLFNSTIKENIRYGHLSATDAEIEEAAKAAEIHDIIISMPEQYNTNIGERGGRLSGGQRQRIAIARALIRKPKILLLDEVTSALDPITEDAINQTINNLSSDLTKITITHKLDSIIQCDYIYLIDHGIVTEQGTHKDLLERNGLYKDLWDKQHGFTINETGDKVHITLERLKHIPLFDKLHENSLAEIASKFKTLVLNENEMVFEENSIGDRFYIVVRGQLEVFTYRNNQYKKIAILEPGDFFGEIALLHSIPRTANVKTLSQCILMSLNQEDFLSFVNKEPKLRKKIESILESRMQMTKDNVSQNS